MMSSLHESALVYPDVVLGVGATVGPFVVIGEVPRGHANAGNRTVIGLNAIIRSHTVIYAGNTIGERFQTGHGVLIREANTIGDDVSIGSHSIVEHHVVIADRVRIHSNVFIPEYSVLEEGAWIGPCVVFTNALYPLSPDVKKTLKGPHICAGAKVGANVTLLPGITIGCNALIGAGAVVVQDVPDGKVVAGNPARIIRDVSDVRVYQSDLGSARSDDREDSTG